jgi:hypothetical protein
MIIIDATDTGRPVTKISMEIFSVTRRVMHLWGYVNVYADVEILKLGVHQWVDANTTNARLKGPGRYRHAITDFQRSFLAIHGANLRLLQELSIAVRHQRDGGRLRNDDVEVG